MYLIVWVLQVSEDYDKLLNLAAKNKINFLLRRILICDILFLVADYS
jgi:uncharacterized Tic20 family protein